MFCVYYKSIKKERCCMVVMSCKGNKFDYELGRMFTGKMFDGERAKEILFTMDDMCDVLCMNVVDMARFKKYFYSHIRPALSNNKTKEVL